MGRRETERFVQSYLAELGIARTQKGFLYLTYCLMAAMEDPIANLKDTMEHVLRERNYSIEWNICYQRCAYAIKNATNKEVSQMSLSAFICYATDNLNHRLIDFEKEEQARKEKEN